MAPNVLHRAARAHRVAGGAATACPGVRLSPGAALVLLCKPYDLQQIVDACTTAFEKQVAPKTVQVPFFSSVRINFAIAFSVS
jgi:hypothetical protein